MQLDAAPLEAAFLKNVARGGIGDPCAGNELFDIEFLEGKVDHRTRGLGAETSPPMLDAEPIAELRHFRLAPVDADDSDWRMIAFDQEHGFAPPVRDRTDKLHAVIQQIRMR